MSHLFWVYAPLNEEPSVIKKILKVFEAVVTFILIVWTLIFILLLPAWFSEKHIINNHVIYSNNNVNSELLQNVLNIAKEKMKKSAVDMPKSLPTIYLYKNDTFFNVSLLNFFSNTTTYDPFYNRIHIKLNDLYANEVLNQDWLSTLITHETTHRLLVERYGILTYTFFMPNWTREGYAEYVSHNHAPPDKDYKEWLTIVRAGKNINQSFESWILVRHAIDEMGYSVDALHNGDVDRETVEQSLLNWVEKRIKNGVN